MMSLSSKISNALAPNATVVIYGQTTNITIVKAIKKRND
ncbi:unnamed protein product [Arabidopsis halleri]